jgi:hypothetical protein
MRLTESRKCSADPAKFLGQPIPSHFSGRTTPAVSEYEFPLAGDSFLFRMFLSVLQV